MSMVSWIVESNEEIRRVKRMAMLEQELGKYMTELQKQRNEL